MKLKAVICGGKKHMELIRAGYQVHHFDSNFGLPIVYMTPPCPKENK